jgi:hypothetical protein
VLNRADSGVWQEHIEATLDMRVDATIVSNGRVAVAAANEGVPLLLLDPSGKEQITRDVRRLVSRVAGEPDIGWETAAPPRPWWQFWRRGQTEPRIMAVPRRESRETSPLIAAVSGPAPAEDKSGGPASALPPTAEPDASGQDVGGDGLGPQSAGGVPVPLQMDTSAVAHRRVQKRVGSHRGPTTRGRRRAPAAGTTQRG